MTCSRNVYRKLVQVVLYNKLARVSVNLVKVFLVQSFFARNYAQFYFRTETLRQVTQTVQHDWPASCYRFCCH